MNNLTAPVKRLTLGIDRLNGRKPRRSRTALTNQASEKPQATLTPLKPRLLETERWFGHQCPFMDDYKPLAIGFRRDALLRRPDCISRSSVREYLKIYTSRGKYYRQLVQENAVRINFDGSLASAVTDHQKGIAQQCLDRRTVARN